jgi:hypothetical protein
MSLAILVEIDVTSPAGVVETLRFSDRSIPPFPPSDPTHANLTWDERLVEPPTIRRALFDDLASLSPGLTLGALRLANADRGLDLYQGHAWGEARIWRWSEGTEFGDAASIMTGLTTTPAYSLSGGRPGQVSVGFFDYRSELEGSLQTHLLAGTNGTGSLYEGDADGLKGRPVPLALGRLDDAHLPAPQVNAAALAYQLNDGQISGPVAIFDRGDAAGFADQGALVGSAFDAFTPAPASWVRDLSRGLLKINGDPVGTLTFGCRGDSAGGYVETTGPVLARLLARAGVPPGRIGASVAGFIAPAIVGAWFSDPIAGREAVGWVARSASAALLPDRLGVWNAVKLAPPAGVEHHTIGADEVVDIEADETAPEPVGEVQIGWGRIWTTFKGNDLAPALRGTSTESRLAEEYRWAIVEDAVAKARFPRTWRTLKISTALRTETDALALAAELKALFGLRPDGRRRNTWRVQLELTPERLTVDLGKTIRLTYPEAGIDDRFVLLAEEPMRPRRDLCTWTLWG